MPQGSIISDACEPVTALIFVRMHPKPLRKQDGVVRTQFGRAALMDASPDRSVKLQLEVGTVNALQDSPADPCLTAVTGGSGGGAAGRKKCTT